MTAAPIALNGRFTGTAQPTGTQTAAYGLFDAIIREPRERPVVVFADPRFLAAGEWASVPRTTLVEIPFQDWSRRKAQFWEQMVFPRLSRKWNCALAHHPMTTCPAWQAGVKTVVTLHDLNFYLHPEWYSRSFRLVYRLFAIPGMRRADRVVTISDYVRRQAIECLHLRPERVSRIYNGVKPTPTSDDAGRTSPPYILAVGSLQPHKNLPRLVRAYQQLRANNPELELWIVGRPQPRFAEMPELTELLKSPGVKLLGYLSEADLASAYRHARVFCYPSLEEGFGLPLLEAMQAGTLVVTSNVSCLPEIAGPACLCLDPLDETAIARGVEQMLQLSPAQRAERVAQGRAWTEKFQWQNAARDYLRLYEEVLA
jgi:glycosyltransferase involved in cell wall biosynthesis